MGKTRQSKIIRLFFKTLKILGISIASILILMFLLPMLFPGKITSEIKTFANKKLNAELNFKEANLSFFKHFPSLTLSLKDFCIKGSPPYVQDTLVAANSIGFGINLKTLIFGGNINIDKIYLDNAFMNIMVSPKGEANYNIYVSKNTTASQDSSNTSLHLQQINITNSHLVYNDSSTKILINAIGFNYNGSGNLDQAVFDLQTRANIDSFNLAYDGETYLNNKKVHASLITKINTHSLSLVFAKNDLKINKLPVDFKGRFDFLSNGYNMDFILKSDSSRLNDLFTALPPAYVTWLNKSKVQGVINLLFTLKGKYIASENIKPDMAFNMNIRNGLLNYNQAPISSSNIYLNFQTKMPNLDPEKLEVNLDTLFFNLGSDYVKATLHARGITKPYVNAQVTAKINLEKMFRTLGYNQYDIRGSLDTHLNSKGVYDWQHEKLPIINGVVSLKNGYIKTNYYPNPITAINLMVGIQDEKGTLKDLKINMDPASFTFEGNPIYVKANLENFDDIAYDIDAKGVLDVGRIYKVFSQKGLDLDGYVDADISLKGTQKDAENGNYNRLNNRGRLLLRNIKTTSDYFPLPFIIKEGLFTFHQEKMQFKNFKAVYGKSDFAMNGYLQNVIAFTLTKKAILKGSFNFNSKYADIDEFMSKSNASKNSDSSNAKKAPTNGVVVIPPSYNLQLKAQVNKLNFQGLQLDSLHGNLTINKGQLHLIQSGFNLIGCHVLMDLLYKNRSSQEAGFDYSIDAQNFDVKKAYQQIKMFRDMATAAKDAEGIISLNYKIAGNLNTKMQPVYPSLTGSGTLTVNKVQMKGFKLFGAVSDKTKTKALDNPNLSEIKINTSIKNSIINIQQFKFKVAGFRPRIEGQTTFDGKLAIKMRLGLPPLGIIGIPLKITGTEEKPKISIGRKIDSLPANYN